MEFDSHLALVRAGLGIALIPRLGRAPLGPDLVAVPVADPVPSREIVALHRASMSDSPAIAALLAALAGAGRRLTAAGCARGGPLLPGKRVLGRAEARRRGWPGSHRLGRCG